MHEARPKPDSPVIIRDVAAAIIEYTELVLIFFREFATSRAVYA